ECKERGTLCISAGTNRQVLPTIHDKRHRSAGHRAVEDVLPQYLAGFRVERSKSTYHIPREDEIAARGQDRPVSWRPLLILPKGLPRRRRNCLEPPDRSCGGI